MNIVEHINVFDFDETLFRVPGYTSPEARDMTPYEWFDSPASLAKEFNIKGIANTIEKTKQLCHNMLITQRVPATRARVMSILEENGIKFDEVHFLGRGSQKAETVLDTIKILKPKSITIFEDSLWEILSYTSYFLDAGLRGQIHFKFYFVDKSKVMMIDWETAVQMESTIEVEKLRIL